MFFCDIQDRLPEESEVESEKTEWRMNKHTAYFALLDSIQAGPKCHFKWQVITYFGFNDQPHVAHDLVRRG